MTTPRKRGTRPKRPYAGPRPGYDDKRYKANRERLKLTGNNICIHCGFNIDLQLKNPHPLSWSADHVIPRAHLSPNDPRQWQIEFLRESHLRCNEARGAKPITPPNPPTQNTSIEW